VSILFPQVVGPGLGYSLFITLFVCLTLTAAKFIQVDDCARDWWFYGYRSQRWVWAEL